LFLYRALRPTIFEFDVDVTPSFTQIDDVVFVGRTSPDDWDFYDAFRSVAKQYRRFFSFLMGPPAEDKSTLVCYNNLEGFKRTASDPITLSSIKRFVELCSSSTVPVLTKRNAIIYRSVGIDPTGRQHIRSPNALSFYRVLTLTKNPSA
jgi:hypothetical protein